MSGTVFDCLFALGPITVLNKTIFDVVANHPGGPNYLQFIGWVYLWGAIFHWITAALNCKFKPLSSPLLPKDIQGAIYLDMSHCSLAILLASSSLGYVCLAFTVQILTCPGIPSIRCPSAHSPVWFYVATQRVCFHHTCLANALSCCHISGTLRIITVSPARTACFRGLRYAYVHHRHLSVGVLGSF